MLDRTNLRLVAGRANVRLVPERTYGRLESGRANVRLVPGRANIRLVPGRANVRLEPGRANIRLVPERAYIRLEPGSANARLVTGRAQIRFVDLICICTTTFELTRRTSAQLVNLICVSKHIFRCQVSLGCMLDWTQVNVIHRRRPGIQSPVIDHFAFPFCSLLNIFGHANINAGVGIF